jgi:ketosteroid isomerase-like protein
MTMTKTICCLAALAFSASALAADKAAAPAAAAPAAAAPAAAAPAGMPDMTKMGPMSRPATKQDKKGVDDLYKTFEEAMKKGDANAAADLVDFPAIMLSDDSKGAVKHFNATREQWLGIMTPFIANMPKDMKMSSKHAATFLSDTLAVSIEQNGMTMGKTKGKWSSMSVLTLKDGKWKFKEMSEAGWGDMTPPGTAAAPAGAAPAAAKAAAKK